MFVLERVVLAVIAVGAYGVLCALCFRRGRSDAVVGSGEVLVAYASQSGKAMQLARETAQALGAADLIALNRLDASKLSQARRLLVVASTYGEGEAPDNGARFDKSLRHGAPEWASVIAGLDYGVLALGDSAYPDFCAYGRRLDQELARQGARRLFDRIELDASEADTDEGLQRWFREATGRAMSAQATAAYQSWILDSRTCLNAEGSGAPLYYLQFLPGDSVSLQWQAGDIVEVLPRQSEAQCRAVLDAWNVAPDRGDYTSLLDGLSRRQLPLCQPSEGRGAENGDVFAAIEALPLLTPREYSIASIPEQGKLSLLLRERRDDSGELGVASRYLTQSLALGEEVALRMRPNPLFHTPAGDPPLILIGSGSGLAGLWGHLLVRQLTGARQNWLLFGEREPFREPFIADQIAELKQRDYLTKVDLVYSRVDDGGYVQDRLRQRALAVVDWVDRGAVIMVCGARQGMGEGVNRALIDILGPERLAQLMDSGRYRRDVY